MLACLIALPSIDEFREAREIKVRDTHTKNESGRDLTNTRKSY